MTDYNCVRRDVKHFIEEERVNVFATFLDRTTGMLTFYVDRYNSSFPNQYGDVRLQYEISCQ